MTPATLAHTLWTTRRGVGLMVGGLMAIMGLLLYAIITSGPRDIVIYGSLVIAPERSEYCPGDIMLYPVEVVIDADDVPVILRVNEAWYREADGVTLRVTATSYELPILRPVNVNATARRVVPDLAPGVYWLDHISVNGRAEAYTVGPVTVKDCTE
jgi:hypothetical protein